MFQGVCIQYVLCTCAQKTLERTRPFPITLSDANVSRIASSRWPAFAAHTHICICTHVHRFVNVCRTFISYRIRRNNNRAFVQLVKDIQGGHNLKARTAALIDASTARRPRATRHCRLWSVKEVRYRRKNYEKSLKSAVMGEAIKFL